MTWAIWVTGPPGSGKTAVARAAAALIRARGEPVRVLELDAIRKKLTPHPQYTDAERDLVYRALAYMAALLAGAGIPVIVDATAHRRAWRDAARVAIPQFAEVELRCPLEVCRERERGREGGHAPAGVYAAAERPDATVPGVNVPYEPPLAPALVIDTTVDDIPSAAAKVAWLAARFTGAAADRVRAWG